LAIQVVRETFQRWWERPEEAALSQNPCVSRGSWLTKKG
jgi:hypothetical protein